MVGGSEVQLPPTKRSVKLQLIASKDGYVHVVVRPGLTLHPQIERPASGDPPGGIEISHDLQQARCVELLVLPEVPVIVPDHLLILGYCAYRVGCLYSPRIREGSLSETRCLSKSRRR